MQDAKNWIDVEAIEHTDRQTDRQTDNDATFTHLCEVSSG